MTAKRWDERVDAVAASKIKMPGWSAWIYTRAPQGGVFLTGAVCPPVTRGPRAGKPNYRKHDPATKMVVYLTAEESA